MINEPALFAPSLTTAQVARALGLTGNEFRNLQNINDPGSQIRAQHAPKTPHLRWNPAEALRFAVIHALPFRLSKIARKHLYDDLTNADIKAAVRGEQWLMLDGFRAVVTSDLATVHEFGPCQLVNLHEVCTDALDALEAARAAS